LAKTRSHSGVNHLGEDWGGGGKGGDMVKSLKKAEIKGTGRWGKAV